MQVTIDEKDLTVLLAAAFAFEKVCTLDQTSSIRRDLQLAIYRTKILLRLD